MHYHTRLQPTKTEPDGCTVSYDGRILYIGGGRCQCRYRTEVVEGAVLLVKLDDGSDLTTEAYYVRPHHRSCTCKGWKYGGRCKHLEAVTLLAEMGCGFGCAEPELQQSS